MTFLLFVSAALVAVSGGLKLRSTSRVGLGMRPLALVELVSALVLAALILPSHFSGTAMVRWAVPAAILLLVVSSVDHALQLREYRHARAESEGGRLATYVKYLSELPKGDEGGEGSDFDTTSRDDPTP